MKDNATRNYPIIHYIRRQWLWFGAAASGFIIHAGTAILRLRTFFPVPKLIDFATFYVYACAIQQDLTPRQISPSWFAYIQNLMRIPIMTNQLPPVFWPLWPRLLAPLTFFEYNFAVWVWLSCNLGVLYFIARKVIHSIRARKLNENGSKNFLSIYELVIFLVIFALIITFGPIFLDLSIGQVSIILLALCIITGGQLQHRNSWLSALLAGLAIALAAFIKFYPIIWLIPLVFMRRWKSVIMGLIVSVLIMSIGYLTLPENTRNYWLQLLPQSVTSAAMQNTMDDQSLGAWVDRLTQPQSYDVPGLDADQRTRIIWQPVIHIDARWSRWGGYLLSGLLILPVIHLLLRLDKSSGEGGFYLWVLIILAIFPHMERYNHALLLPAMLWLWQRRRPRWVIAAYLLTGLSRLNHLWITLLPAPLGALASGFGLIAVLVLMGGMVAELKKSLTTTRRV